MSMRSVDKVYHVEVGKQSRTATVFFDGMQSKYVVEYRVNDVLQQSMTITTEYELYARNMAKDWAEELRTKEQM